MSSTVSVQLQFARIPITIPLIWFLYFILNRYIWQIVPTQRSPTKEARKGFSWFYRFFFFLQITWFKLRKRNGLQKVISKIWLDCFISTVLSTIQSFRMQKHTLWHGTRPCIRLSVGRVMRATRWNEVEVEIMKRERRAEMQQSRNYLNYQFENDVVHATPSKGKTKSPIPRIACKADYILFEIKKWNIWIKMAPTIEHTTRAFFSLTRSEHQVNILLIWLQHTEISDQFTFFHRRMRHISLWMGLKSQMHICNRWLVRNENEMFR